MKSTAAIVVIALALMMPDPLFSQEPIGTEFTYQGQLKQNGSPVTGLAEFIFTLWDDPVSGEQVGLTVQTTGGHSVVNGLFTIELDFCPPDSNIFNGTAFWLQVEVKYPATSGTWETLSPRQHLTATPYASTARYSSTADWDGLINVPPGFADGIDDVGTNGFWSLTGNAGSTPGTHFLGTTDNTPVELRVNNTQVALIEQDHLAIQAPAGVGINTNGPLAGLHVEAEGNGIIGKSTSETGSICGGYFSVNSQDGYGIAAINHSLGNTITPAVYGEHAGLDWAGVGVEGLGGSIGVCGSVMPTGDWAYDGVMGMVYGGNGWNSGITGYAGDGELNFGIYGDADGEGENYGVYGRAVNGDVNYAGYFDGNVFSYGEITRDYNGTESRATPLAYGYVHWHGGLNDATANVVSSMFTTNGSMYEIEIADADFSGAFYYDYTISITVQGEIPAFGTWTGSPEGKLHVHIWNHNGARIMGSFCFVVYKPVITELAAKRVPLNHDKHRAMHERFTKRSRSRANANDPPLANLARRIARLEAKLQADETNTSTQREER